VTSKKGGNEKTLPNSLQGWQPKIGDQLSKVEVGVQPAEGRAEFDVREVRITPADNCIEQYAAMPSK
jgi:hypothetical protein